MSSDYPQNLTPQTPLNLRGGLWKKNDNAFFLKSLLKLRRVWEVRKLGIAFAIILYTLYLIPNAVSAAVLSKAPNNLGLVGYWPMNEGVGTKAGDSSGQGNTGSITGATWTSGKHGKALSFDGSSNYVNIGSSASLNLTGAMTVCAWFNASDSTTNGEIIADINSFSDTITWAFEVNRVARRIGFLHGSGGDYMIVNNNTNFTTGVWTHGCAVRNGSSGSWTVTFYLNGASDGAPTSASNPVVNQTTAIGRAGAGGDYYFKGKLDDVRIYNRALSASEVAKLYKAGGVEIGAVKAVEANLPANAAIAYIRQDCTGYSPCYNSLFDWEAAYGGISFTGCTTGDLTCGTLNKSAIAIIDGNWTSPDTAAVTISGWTTGPNNYIKIYTTAAARHNGKWNTGKYNLSVADSIVMDVREDYVNIDGLQIASISPTASDRDVIRFVGPFTASANKVNVSNTILKGHGHATWAQVSVYADADNLNLNLWNIISYGITANAGGPYSNRGIGLNKASATVSIYSSTFTGGYRTIQNAAGTLTVKNSYAGGSAVADFLGTIAQTTNASSDTTAVGTSLDSIAVNTTNFTNVTAGSEDFHLPSGSALINVGTNTSGEAAPLNFTTDIDRQTRRGAWDIGADEKEGITMNASSAKMDNGSSLESGLVGYWTFDGPDISGANALDKSGSGNTGTIVGATKTIGKLGQALKFNGTSDFVLLGDPPILNFGTGNFSASVWVYPTETDNFTSIIDFTNNGVGGWAIQDLGGLNWIDFMLPLNARARSQTFTRNIWHHVVAIRNGSTISIYVDGVKGSDNTDGSDVDTNPNPALGFSFGGRDWSGKLDDVRIYNRALSASEILQLYRMGK